MPKTLCVPKTLCANNLKKNRKLCIMKSKSFKLLTFDFEDIKNDYDEEKKYQDNHKFIIKLFGLNEEGKTCSITAIDYTPFFYVKVPFNWSINDKELFVQHVKDKVGKYYENSITESKIIKRKKLYGYDGGKQHKFIVIKMQNMRAFYKARSLWYNKDRRLKKYVYRGEKLELYEANIPPLLRFFHIREISPSGWIQVDDKFLSEDNLTTCDYEYVIPYKKIIPLNDKEDSVPYKVCSFDIEASSSHGDFPLPIKDYKKLASNIVHNVCKLKLEKDILKKLLIRCVHTAFKYDNIDFIETIYIKKEIDKQEVDNLIDIWLNMNIENIDNNNESDSIESMFKNIEEDDDNESNNTRPYNKLNISHKSVLDLILSTKLKNDEKIIKLNTTFKQIFPPVEGDKVTFIGSTFTNHGQSEPYLNHCIVLDTCDKLDHPKNSAIESYSTEKDVLLAWTKLIQKENPDIIIGYNIFGFDYPFLFKRAAENNCVYEFLQLSRIRNELCGKQDDYGNFQIEQSSIVIASGQHDLHFIKMHGRLQIDLYNYFRRSCNLEQYKLDYVSGYFIGDGVKQIVNEKNNTYKITSQNLAGLKLYDFVAFEEIEHTNEKYNDGEKFQVVDIDKGYFKIKGDIHLLTKSTKKIRWCLAKDDVTPQDIFRLTNEGPSERAIVAKYCIQDCNLVYELLKKIDVITEFIEMAKLCSVPINFLVMRGQGIKLTSFISKKCREKGTLMPVIEKTFSNEGYEGAIVLPPKCGLYLEHPVACVDYSSLYPSSMISENLCHSTKVWTKEFDLQDNLLKQTGDEKYDNLENCKFVDVKYDTFKYVRKTAKSAAVKVKTGYKICRFEQTVQGIMPSVLEELLSARKATKKLKATETDPFMKNILDKRQLSIKLTANSLYGQTGAKTSSFYEPDVAASTTATGRKLLTYAKRLIEEVYSDNICETKNYGKVRTKAQYIYGDTDSVFFCFFLQELDGTPIINQKALEITIELAQEVGELASKFLKKPHDLEYEKTFLPFCLLSKKRYVGMLYEFDPNDGKRKSMGIVLKRRDNAPIVKDVYGGIIDILMKQKDINRAIEFLQECLQNIIDEKYPMNKLIITKSLRSHYKNPDQIAHKVLADRIAKREPGNKPKSGDRIPFAYIVNENKKALQGEKIETPAFIEHNKLKIDYAHYITNQIMKPVQQVFALVLEEIPSFKKKICKVKRIQKELEIHKKNMTPEKYKTKEEQIRNNEIKVILFDKFLKMCKKDNKQKSITDFFGK